MNKFNYEEWIVTIEDVYSKIKTNVQELYSIKDSLDGELSILFVEKVSTFYNLLVTLQEDHSLEGQNSEVSLLLFPYDLQKVMKAYSAVLKFETIVEDLTGKKVKIPEQIWNTWLELKKKFLDDFEFTTETSNLEVLARFKDKDLLDSASALESIFKNNNQANHYMLNAPYLFTLYRSMKKVEKLVIEDLLSKEYGTENE